MQTEDCKFKTSSPDSKKMNTREMRNEDCKFEISSRDSKKMNTTEMRNEDCIKRPQPSFNSSDKYKTPLRNLPRTSGHLEAGDSPSFGLTALSKRMLLFLRSPPLPRQPIRAQHPSVSVT
ncbi:hypothetical protein TNCV_272631 [Trichonephila clavipes]|nr:hypothetical protein TNCV_272631 [Trichonephila clavipes]